MSARVTVVLDDESRVVCLAGGGRVIEKVKDSWKGERKTWKQSYIRFYLQDCQHAHYAYFEALSLPGEAYKA